MRRTLAAVKPDQLRRHHRARLALPAGADGQYPAVRRPQERPRADRLSASDARGGAQGNLRHLRLPGAGDGGGQGARRLSASARPTCCAARWARRSSRRWTPSAPRFVEGCGRSTTSRPAKANELFDLIDKFAGYGFNKSHAAAYALVAYQTAWLKAHHPVEFYAASMCFDMAPDRQARHLRRRHAAHRRRLPAARRSTPARPNSRSSRTARATPSATRSARSRASARRRWSSWSPSARRNGPFESLDDFAARIDPRLLNRRQIESLAGGGAFDGIAERCGGASPRPRPSSPPPPAPPTQRTSGQGGLFGEGPANVVPDPHADAARAGRWPSAWPRRRRASASISPPIRSTLPRHLLAAHKARELRRARRAAGAGRRRAHRRDDGRPGRGARWRTSARGRRYMMATLSDACGQFEATVFDDEPSPRARGRGQGGQLRPADRRARPPPGRGDAAGHGQALPAARQLGEEDPASASPADCRRSCIACRVTRIGSGARRHRLGPNHHAGQRRPRGNLAHRPRLQSRCRSRRPPHPDLGRGGGRTQRAGAAEAGVGRLNPLPRRRGHRT